jgi:hypothetical protein
MHEPEDRYHARSKNGEMMSSGMLKKFRQCPAAYNMAVLGLAEEKDSPAYRFGRAVHKICLEGIAAFNKAYAIGGPINEKTGKSYGVGTKAHDEWLAANGYSRDQVINEDEWDTLVTMGGMITKHPQASVILDYGWPELVVRNSLHGVPCQVRVDWLTHDASGSLLIVDLKTVDDITWFQTDAYRYEYPHQFAFYRDLVQISAGAPCTVAAIAVEKKEPFRVGVWEVPEEVLDYHSALNKEALEHFKQCQVADVWPTGYESVRTFPMPRIGA